MNTRNSKTSQSNRFRLYFTKKLDLKGNKTISLANLSIYYTWQNVKEEYKNNNFKLSGPTWSELVTLPDVATQLLIFKIIFCLLLKNTRLMFNQVKNHQF